MTVITRARCLLLILLLSALPALGSDARIWRIDINGAIGPASADHFMRGMEQAIDAGAELVILRLDTPGGLDQAMRDIIKTILDSPIPIACHVAPSGARAASAGTYIMYACHIAAMAPATNLGAATPVQMGGPGLPGTTDDDEEKDAPSGSAMERKMVNDAVAYLESLAELRGRNAEWAEAAVREGASLSAEKAYREGVIDLLAGSTKELLEAIDGRPVFIGDRELILDTAGAEVYQHEADWRNQFLSVITNPNVAYILLLVGIYGIIFEFSNPGMGVPGVVGVICLLLALYALQVLPISYAGLALIFVGIAMMVAEVFVPSFGVLGIGGLAAFVVGSIILMDTDLPAYQVAMPIIAAVAVSSAILLIAVLGMAVRSTRSTIVTGLQRLVGQTALVESVSGDVAFIRLDGELWQAVCDQPLTVNDKVSVAQADGVMLKVNKLASNP